MGAENVTPLRAGVMPRVSRYDWLVLVRQGFGEYRGGVPYALYVGADGVTTWGPVRVVRSLRGAS